MILGNQFIGMYLYGSLASGGFNPETSDIDFLVVTSDELSSERIDALENMHASLAVSGLKWAAKLEGAYIPKHAALIPMILHVQPLMKVNFTLGIRAAIGLSNDTFCASRE